jgi:hypothetical protein
LFSELAPFYGPGVVVTAPALISASIQKAVAEVLATVPDDKHAAILGVATRDGVNLVFAARVGDHLEVAAWVGSAWHAPVDAGVEIKAVF